MTSVETTLVSDRELLRELGRTRNADVFAQIVERYLGLVYSAARRQVDASTAEDVTQAVFVLLWQRAASIRDGATLAGWLVNATRLCALQANRTDARRRRRELIAAANRPLTHEQAVNPSDDQLSPILDEALNQLGETERTAVVLRYLQEKSIAEVAAAIGITESAAAKRVSRGVERLRRAFAQRGLVLPSASIPAALLTCSQHVAPPVGLISQVVSSAAIGGHTAGAAIAKGVAFAMTAKKITSTVAAVALLLLIGGGAWMAWSGGFASSDDKRPVVVVKSPPHITLSSATQPLDRSDAIRVGVVVSYRTATDTSVRAQPFGYNVQTRIAPDLRASDIELFPIVEPGTENMGQMPSELDRLFPGKQAINGADPDALKQFDVIVANEVWLPTDELLDALEKAVSGGVSFLNNGGIGGSASGPDGPSAPQTRLAGLLESGFGQTDNPIDCEVVSQHPILGGLADVQPLRLRPNGVFGGLPLGATALIKVTDMSVVRRAPPVSDPNAVFCPIYISQLGKGKIVGVNFAPYRGVPTALQGKGRSDLFIRCVRWLAGRKVD